MWTTGVQGFDTLPYSDHSGISIWIHHSQLVGTSLPPIGVSENVMALINQYMHMVGWWFGKPEPKNLPGVGRASQFLGVLSTLMPGADAPPCLDSLFRPVWSCLATGSKTTVVVNQLVWSQNAGIGRVTPGNELVRLSGLIPPDALCSSCVTVLGAVFLSAAPIVDLELNDTCTVLCHCPVTFDRLFNLVEVCAGAGLSSFGLERAGFRHCCSVELQPKLAELHRQLHANIPVICADITHDGIAAEIFEHCPKPGLLMSDIACQPYSRGGLQHGEEDLRAGTLPATLRLAHHLQVPALIIECVTPAQANGFVQKHLAAFSEQLGYKVVQCTLKLEQVWAAYRYRWWVLATQDTIGSVKIPVWPSQSPLVVRDLMPYVKRWPEEDERQLILNALELGRFELAGQPLRSYAVKPDAKLPTALHSWGGQTQGCACDCRQQGFSDGLLTSKGLYAQLLQLPAQHDCPGVWRHLHVHEVALLNGVPIQQNWSADQRLNLCAIGQMAAPMQSLWVGASLTRHLQQLFTHDPPVDQLHLLSELKKDMLCHAKDLYPMIPKQLTMPPPCRLIVHEEIGIAWVLQHDSMATVDSFVAAYSQFHGVHSAQVWIADDKGEAIDPALHLAMFASVQVRTSEHPCTVHGMNAAEPEPGPVSTVGLCPDVSVANTSKHPCTALVMHAAVSEPGHVPTAGPCLEDGVLPTQQDAPDVDMSPKESHGTDGAGPVDVVGSPVFPCLPSNQDAMVASLLSLQAHQFVQQAPPLVFDLDLCNTMRQPTITVKTRNELLAKQDMIWADDEIMWHLQTIADQHGGSNLAVLDPLMATTCLLTNQTNALEHWHMLKTRPTKIASVVLTDGHWIPCLWISRTDKVEVLLWDHEEVDVNPLNPLHGMMCKVLGAAGFQLVTTRRQFGRNMCGAAAVVFLKSLLNGATLPSSEEVLPRQADNLRLDFQLSHIDVTLVARPWSWGAGSFDVVTVTSALLQQHGVPEAAAVSRAKLLIQGVGFDHIKQAVQGGSPWKTIKNLANQQQPPFQLVLPDELANVAQARQAKQSKGKKKQTQKFQPNQGKAVEVDPARLLLADDTFRTGDGNPAQQLALSQVGPLAAGVALVSYQDALPFLQAGKLLTHQSLALLIVNGPDDLQTALQWSTLRFAAKCSVNQQPVLLSGFLVQLGSVPVEPYFKSEGTAVGNVPVACARLTVFADQWPGDWGDFADHPFKQMLATLQPLQTCRQDQCQCAMWHPGAQPSASDVLLDVFRRQFFTDGGRPTRPANASHFSVQVRYLKVQEQALLRLSGQNGLYQS